LADELIIFKGLFKQTLTSINEGGLILWLISKLEKKYRLIMRMKNSCRLFPTMPLPHYLFSIFGANTEGDFYRSSYLQASGPLDAVYCGWYAGYLFRYDEVPALAFGLGLYIPLELNIPLLVGGIISYVVSNRSNDSLLNKLRHHRGILISSGFVAGGSLMGY
jgi:hypothetical protein